ncbi:MAG: segregation/condensation protein A [Deltaproteobacteria bacterium]|nr:segregation/condensation protein A [Deltaproteobacteria bacterium]
MAEASFEEYSHFFEVQLDLFNGPIDLLLHLVKQRELPIEKLSLAAITDQYLHCIESASEYDLEIAGEYLVIAATLLSIKASILLNEPVELVPDDEGNLVDPHEELLRRLREAQIYKDGASHLAKNPMLGIDVFAAPSSLSQFEDPDVKFVEHDPMLLGRAFRKLLEQSGQAATFTISIDSVSIVERMMKILDTLKEYPQGLAFYKLIPDITSRGSIISSFIAMLELCKRQAIKVRQDETFKEIFIGLASENFDATALTSEYDVQAQIENAAQAK